MLHQACPSSVTVISILVGASYARSILNIDISSFFVRLPSLRRPGLFCALPFLRPPILSCAVSKRSFSNPSNSFQFVSLLRLCFASRIHSVPHLACQRLCPAFTFISFAFLLQAAQLLLNSFPLDSTRFISLRIVSLAGPTFAFPLRFLSFRL
jgi:hypothetical protein